MEGPQSKELVFLLHLLASQGEPGTEIPLREVLLVVRCKLCVDLASLFDLAVLVEPHNEEVALQSLHPARKQVSLCCLLVLEQINLIEPFFDNSRLLVHLHVPHNCFSLVSLDLVIASDVAPCH